MVDLESHGNICGSFDTRTKVYTIWRGPEHLCIIFNAWGIQTEIIERLENEFKCVLIRLEYTENNKKTILYTSFNNYITYSKEAKLNENDGLQKFLNVGYFTDKLSDISLDIGQIKPITVDIMTIPNKFQILDFFLNPTCNYNIVVVDGPPGSGKTFKITNELRKYPVEPNWIHDPDDICMRNENLSGQQIINIIDPADHMDIPKNILNWPGKYIFITTDLKSLPSDLRGTKVIHVNIPLPTREELYCAYNEETCIEFDKAGYCSDIDDIPQEITNYHALNFWILSGFSLYKISPQSIGGNLSLQEVLEGIVKNGISYPFKNFPFWMLDNLLNKLILYDDKIDKISFIDTYKKSGMSECIYLELIRNIIMNSEKLVDYRGVYIEKKKTKREKEVEEFETGDLTKKMIMKEVDNKPSLFDFE